MIIIRLAIMVSLLSISMTNVVACSEKSKSNKNDHEYHLIYKFSNASLGPIDGHMKVYLTIKNNVITAATDAESGKSIKVNQIMGIQSFRKALQHEKSNLLVKYFGNGIPSQIRDNGSLRTEGDQFLIEIIQQ